MGLKRVGERDGGRDRLQPSELFQPQVFRPWLHLLMTTAMASKHVGKRDGGRDRLRLSEFPPPEKRNCLFLLNNVVAEPSYKLAGAAFVVCLPLPHATPA